MENKCETIFSACVRDGLIRRRAAAASKRGVKKSRFLPCFPYQNSIHTRSYSSSLWSSEMDDLVAVP